MQNYLSIYKNKSSELFRLLIFLFIGLNYHIYNSINNLLFIILFLVSIIYLTWACSKILFLFKNPKLIFIYIIILIYFLFSVLNFYYSQELSFNINNKIDYNGLFHITLKQIMSFYPTIYLSLILLSVPLFYVVNEAKAIKAFLLLNIICIILLLVSLIKLMTGTMEIGHDSWAKPFMYLFFYNDNVAAKLQHANILFFSSIFIFYSFFNDSKFSKLNFFLVVVNLCLQFFIFSLMFMGLNIIFLLTLFFLSNKKNNFLKKIFYTLISLIVILFIFTKIVNYDSISMKPGVATNKVLFAPIDITVLKFSSIIKIMDLTTDKKYYKKIMSDNSVIRYMEKNYFSSIIDPEKRLFRSINQINSQSDRSIKNKKCFDNKFFSMQHYSKEMSNCESSLHNGIYLFGKIFILYSIAFFIILFIFFKNDKLAIIFTALSAILFYFQLVLDNALFFLVLSFFLTRFLKRNL